MIAFDPRKSTAEVDLIFNVKLEWITGCKPKGGVWTPLSKSDLDAIQAEMS